MKFLQLASGVLLVLFLAFGVLATDDYGKCRPGLPRGTRVSVLLEHNKIATFEVGAKHPPRLREIDGLHGTLLGIDVRPRNQTLWGVTDQGGVYQISLAKSEATLKSHLVSATSGNPLLLVNSTNIGVDFNPVVDRLRVVAEFRNWRVDVDTGITQIDGRIHFAETDKLANTTALLNGVAYTNNFAGTNSTTLYGINVRSTKKSHSSKYTLVIINPPNNGTLTSVGSLEIRGGRFGGFDIWTSRWQDTTCNTALFATDGNFYFVDLRTGKATPVWYDLSGWFYRNCRGLSILGIAIWPTKLV